MAEQRPDRPQRKGARPGGPGNGGLRFGRGLFGWVLFIGLAIMLFMLLSKQGGTYKTIPLSEFMNVLEPGAGANPAASIAAATPPASNSSTGNGGTAVQPQQPGRTGPVSSTAPSTPSVTAAPASSAGYGGRPVIEWMSIEGDELNGKFIRKE